MLRLKLSGKKKQKRLKNGANAVNRKMQKTYPGEYKNKQLRRSRQAWSKFGKRKQAGHVFKKRRRRSSASARGEYFTWGRCLAVFRIISEQGPEIYNRRSRRWCQLQGNTKQTH